MRRFSPSRSLSFLAAREDLRGRSTQTRRKMATPRPHRGLPHNPNSLTPTPASSYPHPAMTRSSAKTPRARRATRSTSRRLPLTRRMATQTRYHGRPSIPFPADSANATTSPEPQTGYVVHHTAYREQPVYRIVHHQVSTAREIIVAGKTHVEWTRCPVCNERHARAYNERVVDHVSPVFCAACGGRHEADYDETVYG